MRPRSQRIPFYRLPPGRLLLDSLSAMITVEALSLKAIKG